MKTKKIIPDNQQRSLSVTSKKIEEELDDIEFTLKGKYNKQITHLVETSYDNETKEKILGIIEEIKFVNKEMFESLSLNPQKTSESRIVRSRVIYLWSILIDSTSEKLTRYGDLMPEESKIIDEFIFRILSLIDKLKEF